ncbi:MAG: alpha/beta hydrolase family protein [Flavobacteriales bacterium]
MARIITTITIASLLVITNVFSQEITGDWYGQLDIQGTKLRVNFHIFKDQHTYTSTMDSPDQGAKGIATETTTFMNDTLVISMKKMNIQYKGILKNNVIEGNFSQGRMNFPLTLSTTEIKEEQVKKRPQDPTEPYGYKSEDVYFNNPKANNIKLAGTLTIPNHVKNPPVAILISGSGPQNRDEEVKSFNHRPFLVLADYLTKNGIAVLRYDDRGVAESEGKQQGYTSADFATDVEAAITFLNNRDDVDTTKIGLIGHSEGGLIAPIVASTNKKVAFVILLAGPGVDGAEVLLSQSKRARELAGINQEEIDFNNMISEKSFNIIKTEENIDLIKEKLHNYLIDVRTQYNNETTKQLTDSEIENQVKVLSSAWMTFFIKTKPDTYLSKTTCPVLALNGEKDFQVLPDLNLNGISKSLKKANNQDVTIKKLKGLNHLFQTCNTGSIEEYAEIEETFSPKAMQLITDWIHKRF